MTADITKVTETERGILNAIGARQERLFALLEELIRFRTPNPPGGNELEAQQWMRRQMEDLGLEVDMWDVLPGRPNVVGRLPVQDRPTVVFNGHIDVCAEEAFEEWSAWPYEPVRDDRDMIGRGVSDMKGALAAYLFVLEILRDQGIKPECGLVVQSVMGEEGGEPGSKGAIARGHTGDFAIVGESSRGQSLVASVGVMTLRIVVSDERSLHLAARRSFMTAGGGLLAANCIDVMSAHILPALGELERQWAVHKSHPLLPPGCLTINVFRIEGGANPFLLPNHCEAFVTVLYPPGETRGSVRSEVETHLRRAAEMDPWLRAHPPQLTWTPDEHPVEFEPAAFDPESTSIQTLMSCIEDSTGKPAQLGGRAGVTDAGEFYAAGIPAVVFGPGNMEYAHRVDERVHLDELVSYARALALFLVRYGRRG